MHCDPLQIQYLHSVTIHFPLTVCRGVHQHQCLLPQRLDVLQHTRKLQRRFCRVRVQAGMSRELQQIAAHTQIRDTGKNSNAVSKLTSIPPPMMDLVTLAKIKLDIILNLEGRLWLAELLSPMLFPMGQQSSDSRVPDTGSC